MKHLIITTCYNKKGQVISCANNSYKKTHPLQKYFAEKVGHPDKIYLHAEIAAILRRGDQKIYSIWIQRRNKKNKMLLAKPCPICQEAIKAFGIKNVYYSTNDGIWERM